MKAPNEKGMYWDGYNLGLPCGNTKPNLRYLNPDFVRDEIMKTDLLPVSGEDAEDTLQKAMDRLIIRLGLGEFQNTSKETD